MTLREEFPKCGPRPSKVVMNRLKCFNLEKLNDRLTNFDREAHFGRMNMPRLPNQMNCHYFGPPQFAKPHIQDPYLFQKRNGYHQYHIKSILRVQSEKVAFLKRHQKLLDKYNEVHGEE